ncbi:zincin-like metallopeptidase domain-containing protein (plasmid) [Acuticoccus sp. MNP-M23]|uniref:ArdC family protein n=1 Tax=Acuticoccus sp. MNP-M23 TaxID=3072793 RepID=UPI0028162064|nr:zincin-like metallopeptidase domain-containing protein [Acuticoccus sp. MNP-M23]WMS45327.1 zincin-like metallopeptidase domain-containing protein [Acuticoccus sp. MNP-M23]
MGKTDRFDVHQHITDQIVTAIEAGADNWQMPWHRSAHAITRPQNIASGKGYRGINVLSLWVAAAANDYAHGMWGTYKQWQEHGAQVKKGEKSSVIVFYKELERAREDDPSETETVLFARASRVFNAAQVEGFTVEDEAPTEDRIEPVDAAEAFTAATGAMVNIGGERAFYRPAKDRIQMPDRERFTGTATSNPTEAWYGTLLHEICHWSGAAHRLDRQLSTRFGDDAYAAEELIAELGAAFLCADLGITSEPRPDHAAYLASWLKILKADKKAVFTAASAAGKAADYLTNLAAAQPQRQAA